jgi:serine/threonine protein kinase
MRDGGQGFPKLEAGSVLQGRFRIVRRIGAGQMGVVVSAHHLERGHLVGLKFIRGDLVADPVAVERLLREARAMAELSSEHVRRIYEVARLEDGTPFIVMEYLEGRDLAALLEKEGPQPPGRAAELIIQACDAVGEAHLRGIIHRDLKPQNIFLAREADGRQRVKVLDFGISKRTLASTLRLTRTEQLLGSPAYSSPEQLQVARDVDARSDIWSLGVVLYELLTGELPFSAPVIPRLVVKILRDPAPSLVDDLPDLSPELDRVVLRCLHKSPSSRFATALELADALRPFAAARGRR